MHRVEKPWGYELIFADTDKYVGKILHVNKGESLSLQYHEKKDETQYILAGKIRLEVEEDGVANVEGHRGACSFRRAGGG